MDITAADFSVLHEACTALDDRGVDYVIGGGTAVVEYGRNRRTKDFDIFLNRNQLPAAMAALTGVGFTGWDTDKRWLYKAWRGEVLIDIIVESRGGVRIDAETMRRSRIMNLYGYDFRLMGVEDTLYRKILTLTEGRPDWYDALSIIERQRGEVDWTYLLARARRYPRRILGFLLFAQTELHVPEGRQRVSPDELYQGDAPGFIPEWVISTLMLRIWRASLRLPATASPALPPFRRAA